MPKNLAQKFSSKVDERFEMLSVARLVAGNKNYSFDGADTVNIYSYPVVPAGKYTPEANDVYGTCYDIEPRLQSMKVKESATFNFRIPRLLNKTTMMTANANKQMSRQINQVIIPQVDHHAFGVAVDAAKANGNYDATTATKENAYSLFLRGQEHMGDVMAPEAGRIAVCSYAYYNLLKQDPAFVRYGDKSQDMLRKGIMGEVDGTKIVRIPSNRLRAGTSCIITHPYALANPSLLTDYIIHDNPPGYNGWKCEGLVIHDAFAINEKSEGIYVIGGGEVTRKIQVCTSPDLGSSTKTVLTVMSAKDDETHKWFYKLDATKADVEFAQDITGAGGWTELTVNGSSISVDGEKVVTVVETDASGKALAVGTALIYLA